MKVMTSVSVALLALAQPIFAAPAPEANTTFVLAAVPGNPPLDIAVIGTFGIYVEKQNGPARKQQRFIYDPATHLVVLDHKENKSESLVYVGPDGHWGATNSTPPQGSNTFFKIQPLASGFGHDHDQQLKAYVNPYLPIANDFKCQDATGEMALYSLNAPQPNTCIYSGALALMVTSVVQSD